MMVNFVQSFLVPLVGTLLICYFIIGQSGRFFAMISGMMAILFACAGSVLFLSSKNTECLMVGMYVGIFYFLVDTTYRIAEKRKFKGAFDRIVEKSVEKSFDV
jgi:hypothetical protein